MQSREELFDRSLVLRGDLLAPRRADTADEARLMELGDVEADLRELQGVPRPADAIDEMHLLYLARCRLIQLGQYRIQSFLGAGQKGSVYRAIDTGSGNEVAIKLLVFPRNEEEVFRFRQEPEILLRLKHDAIVRGITNARTSDYLGADWFAMELVGHATTLEPAMATMAPLAFVKLISKVCDGLQHAHDQGIIHRDLQPKNILIGAAGAPKILDFGAAHYHPMEFTFRPIGTLTTSAPEVFDDPRHLTGKADVFSIGTILYRWRYGEWPFYSETFAKVVQRLQNGIGKFPSSGWNEFDQLIQRTLKRDSAERPTAAELSSGLSSLPPPSADRSTGHLSRGGG